jgi:hypothetical protein
MAADRKVPQMNADRTAVDEGDIKPSTRFPGLRNPGVEQITCVNTTGL